MCANRNRFCSSIPGGGIYPGWSAGWERHGGGGTSRCACETGVGLLLLLLLLILWMVLMSSGLRRGFVRRDRSLEKTHR